MGEVDLMLFHNLSNKMYEWLSKQPNVKEESLTDWLLFELSDICNFIKYYAFTRNEESLIGADWDWWVLTNSNAYRFRIQAKKLRPDKDNWASFSYGNKNGIQIDLLLDSARKDSAFPLYMLYSTSSPDIDEQLSNYKNQRFQEMIKWCADCKCASFLSPTKNIYELIFGQGKKTIHDEILLNLSLRFSSFDYFLERHSLNELSESLELLNAMYCMENMSDDVKRSKNVGFKFDYKSKWSNSSSRKEIPNWLDSIIREENAFNESEMPKWFEGEFRQQLPDTLGFAIVDLRN